MRRGAVLRVPGADEIAALNQSEAISEVHRQMNAWREQRRHGARRPSAPGDAGRQRRRSPAPASRYAANAEAQALKDRVKDLEGQLAESHRLIDIRNSELSALQRKLGSARRSTGAQRRRRRKRRHLRRRSGAARPVRNA